MIQGPKKLLDQVRDAIRPKHYVYSAKKAFVYWAKGFVLYHNKRHPLEIIGDLRVIPTHQEVASSDGFQVVWSYATMAIARLSQGAQKPA